MTTMAPPKHQLNTTSIPSEMKELRQWVVYRGLLVGTGEISKEPRRADSGELASSTNPETWFSFDDAVAAAEKRRWGIGYVFDRVSRICGIDLDDCLIGGELAPWAQDVVDRFPSYTEVSVSGTGLHIFIKGDPPTNGHKVYVRDEAGTEVGKIEFYSYGRYFAMTGKQYPGTPNHICEYIDEANAFHAELEHWNEPRQAPTPELPIPVETAYAVVAMPQSRNPLSDSDIIEILSEHAGNRQKFLEYYRGGFGGKPSNSEAVKGILCQFIFYTHSPYGAGDAQLERLFRQSQLCTPDYDKRHGGKESKAAYECGRAVSCYTGKYYKPKEALPCRSAAGTTRTGAVGDLTQADMNNAALDANEGEGAKGASDDSLAEMWSGLVKDEYAFVEGDQWYRYRGNHWQKSSATQVGIDLHLWLKEMRKAGNNVSVTAAKTAAVQKLTHSYLGLHSLDEYNAHTDWIPLANGVYNVASGKLLPHSPNHKNTYVGSFDYDPTAVCPLWEQCLAEWLITENNEPCEEWINALREWFGYCLVPDMRAQVSMLWSGEGGNGKGVATRVLSGLVGRGNYTSIPIDQLHDPYHRAALYGKLVGFVNEPDRRSMQKNGNWFKAIVGNDEISGRNPTEKPFDFTPVMRIVMSTNELPATNDTSIGYFRRLHMIDWRYNVPAEKRDPDLDDKLRLELPGIFNWAVKGLRQYRERGKLVEPEESKKLLTAYQVDQDSFLRFLKEECDLKDGVTVNTVFYAKYKTWCEDNGEKALSGTMVAQRFKNMKKRSVKSRVNGKSVWCWPLTLHPDVTDEAE